MTRSEPVTELAERHEVSRKFLYQQADKGAQALEQAFQPLAPMDDEVLFYLPVTKAWLRQVVLGLVLLCHSSFRGVMAFFRDLLAQPIALGTVHTIVQEAVAEARRLNAAQDLSRVRSGSHDELFQGHQPVLVGIDLDSTYCYLLALEAHRDAETWAIHLWDLADQGLQPDYIVADGGQGLRAGQATAWPAVPCDGDVFHGLRTVIRLVATLEKRAYAAIARREELEQKMQRAKQCGQGRPLSKPLARARAQETTAIRLADEVQTLAGWLQHDILALAGPDATTRQALYDFVVAALQDLETLDAKRLRPLCRALANQRDTLLAFATRLDQELETLAQQVAVPPALVRELLALQSLPSTTTAYWPKATALHQQLHDGFFPLQQTLEQWRNHFHRASSLVENVNSRLRNYFFLRRQIGPAYLDLLRFFLNHQPFSRSQKPERRGKSPTELLTGQAHPHWLEMLGFTRFTRARCAA
ncbi:MAG: hypothetical protein HGA65_17800 [Oscillochloris sp.]|nr:hypothetical protein [Oscillochloris sp.]